MKWFKHLSQSHTDEKLADLLSECGLEGYGFWWLLMEVVANQCVDDKCCATYTLPHWSRLLYSHHNKVGKYLGKLGVIGIVTVESVEGKVRVTIPNLLKYRDEYSRKSVQKPESVLPKKEKEKEKEKKIKKENIKTDIVKRFVPPSVEEVTAYCLERKNDVDAQKFVDHYQTRNWTPKGYTKQMSDWKSAIRTWEGKNGQLNFGSTTNTGRKTGIIEANGANTDFLG